MQVVLGKGAYGIVYKEIYNGKIVAIKEIKNQSIGNTKNLLELSIMSTYHHPALNKAIAIEISLEGTILIYQAIATSDLKQYIKETGKLQPKQARKWTTSICSGLAFLKRESIVHGDVKPHNILVYSDNVKLTDFGCSVIIRDEPVESVSGTIRYNSPEVLIDSQITYASDVWSLGCVLYEMLTGESLIPSLSSSELSRKLRTAKSIQMWRESEGDFIKNKMNSLTCLPVTFLLSGRGAALLIKSMTAYTIDARMTIEDVQDNLWLNEEVSAKDKQRHSVSITCPVLNAIHLDNALKEVNTYIKSRSITIPNEILNKTVQLYSQSSMSGIADIEASLKIVFKIYKYNLPNYHPLTKEVNLVASIAQICIEAEFRLHKAASNDLYVPIGTCL